jgi:benzoate membrane transport protein
MMNQMSPHESSRSLLPAIGVAIPILIFSITLISLLLAVAETFGLSTGQASTLIMTSYGVSSVLSIAMTWIYRQPLFLIWSTTGIIFIASFADVYSYAELLGATFVAGAAVLILGILGLSSWLVKLIPISIVFGVLAGLIMPFVVRIFSDMDTEPVIVGATVAAFLLARRLLPPHVPPLLPALTIGVLVAAMVGELHRLSDDWTLPSAVIMRPHVSWHAIVTVSPVLVVLMVALSNLSAVVYLRSQNYDPPARMIDMAAGLSTMLSAFVAPVPINMGHFVTPLTAGPDAGAHNQRHWSVSLTSGGLLLVAFTADLAGAIPSAAPHALLFTIAGLALVSVLSSALTEMVKGPLRLGPLFAFVVASSELSLGGFGPAFWALVIGMAVTVLLEHTEWRAIRSA